MAQHKNITQPDKFGYQVRIVRRGEEYSRYFSYTLWNGKIRALNAAISWRDQMRVALQGSRRRFLNADRENKSTGICGVSRTVKYDKRRDQRYLCYQVFWMLRNCKKVRTFHVGSADRISADDDFHAFRTAVAFRYQYEIAIDSDKEFDAARFRDWKVRRLYDERLYH